jgi:hypothetical protein
MSLLRGAHGAQIIALAGVVSVSVLPVRAVQVYVAGRCLQRRWAGIRRMTCTRRATAARVAAVTGRGGAGRGGTAGAARVWHRETKSRFERFCPADLDTWHVFASDENRDRVRGWRC